MTSELYLKCNKCGEELAHIYDHDFVMDDVYCVDCYERKNE